MAEYIVREAAIEICEKEYRERLRMADYCGDTVAWNIGAEIKNMPAADVAPVRHAMWKRYGKNLGECSECGEIVSVRSNYCPNCGAKMDGGA